MKKNSTLSVNSYLRVPFRFSLIQISNNEYRFISISESIKIKFEDNTISLVKIFSKLKDGATLNSLHKQIPKTKRSELKNLIETMLSKGLLEMVKPISNKLSNTEKTYYKNQLKFFSNFYPLPQTVMSGALTEIHDIQMKLKNSTILVIGLGRVGSRVLSGLISAGVGNIMGSDREKVTFEDTVDQIFTQKDVGKIREKITQNRLNADSTKFSVLTQKIDDDANIPPNVDLLVLCEDDFDPQKFVTINKICLKNKIPWISYRNLGLKFEIGPLIIPYETACYKCLELRKIGATNSYADYLTSQQSIVQNKVNRGSLNITMGTDLLVLDVLKILTNFTRSVTYGTVFSFNLISFESALHPILRIPNCPHCSPVPKRPLLDIWE